MPPFFLPVGHCLSVRTPTDVENPLWGKPEPKHGDGTYRDLRPFVEVDVGGDNTPNRASDVVGEEEGCTWTAKTDPSYPER